jgi:dihydrodipicolinate synthase/N-acetylneuraminate lyase
VKWSLAQMGRIEAGARLPMTPLSDRFHESVREALAEAGVSIPGLRVVEKRA